MTQFTSAAGHVPSGDLEKAKRVGRKLRAVRIYLNGAPHGKLQDVEAPFAGYKQSVNGREAGVFRPWRFLVDKGDEPPLAVA
jgi:aldehyde dehydrogenase (NAD+)